MLSVGPQQSSIFSRFAERNAGWWSLDGNLVNSCSMFETLDAEVNPAHLGYLLNGGFLLLLVSALLPGVANAPAEGDDIYTKPSLWEVAKTGSILGEPDGTAGGGTKVAPAPDGRGCTDQNLPL